MQRLKGATPRPLKSDCAHIEIAANTRGGLTGNARRDMMVTIFHRETREERTATIMDISGKTALITGATGFIGGHLARRLQTAEGVQVRALVRSPQKAAPLEALGVEIVPGDVTDPEAVRDAMRDANIVYHAAAWADEQGDRDAVWAVNVGGTQHTLDAALAESVERFIHLSSCAVYGSLQQLDIDETTPPRMTGRVYHDSKVAAEELVFAAHREHGLPAVVPRPSQVYGPGSPQFTIRVIQAVKAGKIILVDGGKHHFKPVYIDNRHGSFAVKPA